MALKCGVDFVRLHAFKQVFRLLSTHTQPNVVQHIKNADFPGARAPYATEIKFLNENSYDPIPIYRVLDNSGEVIDNKEEPNIDKDTLLNMYKTMIQLSQMDKILYESQRQGRISFYMTNYGEEGIHVGSAAALSPKDLVFAQYREAGVFLFRGSTVTELVNQCYGNNEDPGKGKQMPVHYGSKQHNIVTISSPLATQMPQAVGAAYALKRVPNNDRCVICYFGEGAASEGDAHAAFNFAATLDCPVIMLCRNNGYAISTPSGEQYRGDGIAARGPALGLNTIRVDGTDPLAVYNAVARARDLVLDTNKPVLIEAMSYRVGHHSTSDDSSAYRPLEEIDKWTKDESPIQKFRLYLEGKGLWDEETDKAWIKECRNTVVRTMQEAEKKKLPHWKEMLEDVYYDMPPRIQKQMQKMEEHLKKYPEHYPLNRYQSE
ncbi:2-oxoisovalerate dehydrogenase subunit alpha, mitochondrial [Achroia grisella]|uniref:2-oxoisovalerate dehydrogenase subunit alpha, mitochondrial n=1 Tax=Achroia grisella TaxID=688607 RepID=UPI0027D25B98|nr:2-oxoisovalerate dehydrogenase subunit alpha, mitochondrial [Achroia grisella]